MGRDRRAPVVDAYDTGYLAGARLAFLGDTDTLIVQNGYAPQRFDLFDTETGAVPSSMGLVFPTYAGFREEHLGGPPFDITYSAFAVSPDGGLLATATLNDEVALWRIPAGQPETNPTGLGAPGGDRHPSSRVPARWLGARLVRQRRRPDARVWDLDAGRESAVLDFGSTTFGISPDGGMIAWAEADGDGGTRVRICPIFSATGEPRDLRRDPHAASPRGDARLRP